jgi:hypothetical protein
MLLGVPRGTGKNGWRWYSLSINKEVVAIENYRSGVLLPRSAKVLWLLRVHSIGAICQREFSIQQFYS